MLSERQAPYGDPGSLFDAEGPITIAFQPIVDMQTGLPFAYEALVRGPEGEDAAHVLSRIPRDALYRFDQRCRVEAITAAARAGLLETPARLSINFMPNAIHAPVAYIHQTLSTARAAGVPIERLIFEFTESEELADPARVAQMIEAYHGIGFQTALDDFGAGRAGLTLLARFQPDMVKLDMELIRGIDESAPRRCIVGGLVAMCAQMGILIIAEGIETLGEAATLRDLGIRYMQGFLFARPAPGRLPAVTTRL